MNRLRAAFVWLSRIRYCRGFGIQSPTDYRFVRYVINEHWPYYAYERVGRDDGWLRRKLGRLYFRISNDRQPLTVIDHVGVAEYVTAGCRKSRVVSDAEEFDMAIVPIETEVHQWLELCGEHSVLVLEGIHRQPSLWHCVEYNEHVVTTFDLYYCGIVLFDKTKSRNNYKINF